MKTQPTTTPLARKVAALEAGTAKHIAGETVVEVFGIRLTAAEIRDRLAALEEHHAAVAAAQAALATALDGYHAAVPRISFFVRCYSDGLRDLLGDDNPKLRDFGLEPGEAKRADAADRRWVRANRRRRATRRRNAARALAERSQH